MTETPDQFIRAAREGLALATAAHVATWHLGSADRWDADLERGLITFSFEDLIATAPIQVVGTYNTDDGTFLWGWDHPSVPEPLRQHAELARAWGQAHGLPAYTTRKVRCTEDQAWDHAAVANRLAGTSGVYRGPSGPTLVFMTFGEVRLEKKQKAR